MGKESGGTTNRLQEQLGYAYDAAGNLDVRTNNALIQDFNVNSLNQLTTVSRNTTNALTVAGTTTSAATNVTVNTSNAVLYLDRTFASTNHSLVNGDNSFTAIARDSLGRRDTNSITVYLPTNAVYAYDLNGNLTNDSAKVFEYDDENQLTRVTKTNEFKKEYVYDGKMRLRIRKEFAWRSGAWTKTNEIRFIWDGDVIVQQRDANNLPTLTFTRGLDLRRSLQRSGGIGGLLAFSQHSTINPQHSYYHADGNGNVTMLIDANQRQVAKYIYDSFGNPLSVSGSKAFVNPIWFSSQFYDWDTGFLHYKHRIYVPQLQRWLNRDPIAERGGMNLYGFVLNNPNGRIDPWGLSGGVVTLPRPIFRPPVRPTVNPVDAAIQTGVQGFCIGYAIGSGPVGDWIAGILVPDVDSSPLPCPKKPKPKPPCNDWNDDFDDCMDQAAAEWDSIHPGETMDEDWFMNRVEDCMIDKGHPPDWIP